MHAVFLLISCHHFSRTFIALLMHYLPTTSPPNVARLKYEKSAERRKHCALPVVRRSQKILPRRRPLPGDAGRPKFNQLEMVTRPSLVKIDALNFELSW